MSGRFAHDMIGEDDICLNLSSALYLSVYYKMMDSLQVCLVKTEWRVMRTIGRGSSTNHSAAFSGDTATAMPAGMRERAADAAADDDGDEAKSSNNTILYELAVELKLHAGARQTPR